MQIDHDCTTPLRLLLDPEIHDASCRFLHQLFMMLVQGQSSCTLYSFRHPSVSSDR